MLPGRGFEVRDLVLSQIEAVGASWLTRTGRVR